MVEYANGRVTRPGPLEGSGSGAEVGVATEWVPAGYELGELLGFGTCGEVWSGREVATGEPVAVKRLRDDLDAGAVVGRLHRLVVDSQHVVPVRAVLSGPGGVALVTALAAGGSLATLLRLRGRLSAGEAVTVVLPLAQTLAELHAKGIVHGAVSPSNILFTANGRPMLADLGLAELLGAAGPPGSAAASRAPGTDGAPGAAGAPGTEAVSGAAGAARAVGPPAGLAGPAEDVRALAQVCVRSLRGAPGSGQEPRDNVARALLAAADAALAVPASAADFAEGVAACGPPAAVRLVPAADRGPEPGRPHGAPAPRGVAPDPAAAGDSLSPRGAGMRAPDLVDAGRSVRRRRLRLYRPSPTARPRGSVPGAPRSARQRRRLLPSRPVAVAGAGLAALGLAALLGVAWAAAAGPGPAASALRGPSVLRTGRPGAGRPGAGGPGAAISPSGTPRSGPDPSAGAAASAAGNAGGPAQGPSAAPAAVDWASVLGALDSRRAGAFGLLDASLLAQVYAPGARPLAVDRAALRRLSAAGVHAVGLDLQVDRVVVRSAGARYAVLDVVDRLPAYDLAAGSDVVQRQPGRGAASWRIRLVAGPGGWRIQDVRATASAAVSR